MRQLLTLAISLLILGSCTGKEEETNLYSFEVQAQENKTISLKQYKGDIVLIVNTANKCGFTPPYADLQALYAKYSEKGLVILDFPCNQFGAQSPESDSETTQFCQTYYGTEFEQLQQIEVNGANQTPLFAWLKSQQPFQGFDMEHSLGALLDQKLKQQDPNYAQNPDIKWNFTKFLINRKGEVVARFEPTTDMNKVEQAIKELL